MKRKIGRSIYFGTRCANEESADDILLNLCWKQCKKPWALYIWLCEAVLHATSIMSSHLATISLLAYFLSFHYKTVLDNPASTNCCLRLKRKEMRQETELTGANWEAKKTVCAWITNAVMMATCGEGGVYLRSTTPRQSGAVFSAPTVCSIHGALWVP